MIFPLRSTSSSAKRERRKRYPVGQLLIFTLACCFSSSSYSQSWEALRGISIQTKFHYTETRRTVSGSTIGNPYATYQGSNPGSYQTLGIDFELNFYVSTKGNIFEYQKNNNGIITVDAISPDHARDRPMLRNKGLSYTWTNINNKPTRITEYVGGFWIFEFQIDTNHLSCTFNAHLERAPGASAIYNPGSKYVEIRARQLDSYTCKVVRGNVFANDQ